MYLLRLTLVSAWLVTVTGSWGQGAEKPAILVRAGAVVMSAHFSTAVAPAGLTTGTGSQPWVRQQQPITPLDCTGYLAPLYAVQLINDRSSYLCWRTTQEQIQADHLAHWKWGKKAKKRFTALWGQLHAISWDQSAVPEYIALFNPMVEVWNSYLQGIIDRNAEYLRRSDWYSPLNYTSYSYSVRVGKDTYSVSGSSYVSGCRVSGSAAVRKVH